MAAGDVETVREIYSHWSQGDWRYGADLFADDVVSTTFDADGEEIVLHGAEALRGWFRGFLEQWDDFRQEADEVIDCGDCTYVVSHQTATGRASGARLEMPVYNVWRFRDGRVVGFQTTRHEDVARRAAGLPAEKPNAR
jgi:ketosteroid isomerase-like protein